VRPLELIGIKTNLVRPGEDLVEALLGGMERSGLALTDGDVLVVAESAIATAEGGVVNLSEVAPGPRARELAEKYGEAPREKGSNPASADRAMGVATASLFPGVTIGDYEADRIFLSVLMDVPNDGFFLA